MNSTLTGFLSLTILFSSCKPTNPPINHLAWMDTFKDPMLQNVPDSLRYLVPILDSVMRSDQKYRSITDPTLFEKNKQAQRKLDSVNFITVTGILDRYGWLGMKDVGVIGNRAINMTMIHAPVAIKLKYIPALMDAFTKKAIGGETVAMYEDKLNLMLNRRQYYGTQITAYKNKPLPHPIQDLPGLEARRRKMGLSSMQYYMAMFHTKWYPLAYDSILPGILKDIKMTNTPALHVELVFPALSAARDTVSLHP